MATSPTSKSALTSGAAKDDAVGLNNDYTFTIADLLANDPGGAAKLNVGTQFFFGDAAPAGGGLPTLAQQVQYLADHGITANVVDGKFVSFDIDADADPSFNYFVQIGNKGTWSQANVDVTAPPAPPEEETGTNGDLVAKWDFENHTQAGGDNVGTPNGFWNLNEWVQTYEAQNPGFTFGEDAGTGFSTDIQVHGADGHRSLDTAASPGNIFLQAIPEERGGVLGQGATMPDLVEGKQYHAEVSILKQDFSDIPEMVANGTAGTDPDAWVSFQFNDKVLNVHASDIDVSNEFVTFDLVFDGVAGEDSFTIMSHGTNDAAQGLLIDTIQVHDWLLV
jgi:hypothetical protein